MQLTLAGDNVLYFHGTFDIDEAKAKSSSSQYIELGLSTGAQNSLHSNDILSPQRYFTTRLATPDMPLPGLNKYNLP